MIIHFVGVGKMGLPMAQHLRSGGHWVTVSDPSDNRRSVAAEAGLEVIGTPAGAGQAEVVFSSLPDDAALLAVGQELQASARPGVVYIDTSTVSMAASAAVAQLCAKAGIDYLRCCVSGNNEMAEAAQLTVLASGPRALHERMLPLLKTFGSQQFWLGDAEQSRLMKLVVNLLIAQTSAMLADALTLGQKGGIAWSQVWDVIAASAAASPIVKAKAERLRKRDFGATFTVRQMLKDVDLILSQAAETQVPLLQLGLTRQTLLSAQAQGLGDDDYAALIKVVEASAGMKEVSVHGVA